MKTIDITLHTDEDKITQFEEFCSDVGLSVSAAFNIFIYAVLREKKIPFEISVNNEGLTSQQREDLEIFHSMRAEAEKRGFLTDEEIEFEIKEARREMKERSMIAV